MREVPPTLSSFVSYCSNIAFQINAILDDRTFQVLLLIVGIVFTFVTKVLVGMVWKKRRGWPTLAEFLGILFSVAGVISGVKIMLAAILQDYSSLEPTFVVVAGLVMMWLSFSQIISVISKEVKSNLSGQNIDSKSIK